MAGAAASHAGLCFQISEWQNRPGPQPVCSGQASADNTNAWIASLYAEAKEEFLKKAQSLAGEFEKIYLPE